MSKVNQRKATGPDGISAYILKVFSAQLAPVTTGIFNRSTELCHVPSLWKSSFIVPVPKKASPVVHNDYRPVALTPVIMKCMEKLVLKDLLGHIGSEMDPCQFAYMPNKGTDGSGMRL